MHSHCLQDWIWQGCSIECPCCKQTLPQSLVQLRLVERFQRLPDMKARFIEVSFFFLNWLFQTPLHTKKKKNKKKLKTSFFLLTLLTGFKSKQTTMTGGLAKWRSCGHQTWSALVENTFCGISTSYHDRGRSSHIGL